MRTVLIGLGLAALAARMPAQDGEADYRAGRYEAAFAAFAAAAAEAQAPAERRANLALAALRLRRPGDAAAAARSLLDEGDAAWHAPGEFLLGLAAWQRAEQAAAAAQLADAEPMAWDLAVRSAEAAWAHWCRAAAGEREPGPARRNAERAWRRLQELRAARTAAAARVEPEPAPPPGPTEPEAPATARPDVARGELSAEELERLRQRLLAKEREKQRLRLLGAGAGATVGEREW
ncbi:MAG: hypothetical protein KF830_11455 [Planctomycetes bacterium]|nr:hypothetical protein [Planctomycetota bacterium]